MARVLQAGKANLYPDVHLLLLKQIIHLSKVGAFNVVSFLPSGEVVSWKDGAKSGSRFGLCLVWIFSSSYLDAQCPSLPS